MKRGQCKADQKLAMGVPCVVCMQADRACRALFSSYTMHVTLECKDGVPKSGKCRNDALQLVLIQVSHSPLRRADAVALMRCLAHVLAAQSD